MPTLQDLCIGLGIHDGFPKRLSCLIAVWIGLALASSPAIAQDIPPRVVLNTGGPTSQIRQLAFSNDSQRLYAAGLDKVVHTYEVGWANRGNGEPPTVTLASPLHWEQARGNRGSVYAMALASSRPEMVIGGVSARQQTGDIAAINLSQSRLIGSLPTPTQRTAAAKAKQIGTEGHHFAVMSLDYSPSGEAIVSRDENGGAFLWRRNPQGGFNAQRMQEAATKPLKHQPMAIFVDEQNIVFSQTDNGGRVRLVIQSLATGNQASFGEDYDGRVAALARDTSGTNWASADSRGTIYLSDTSNSAKRFRLKAALPNVTAISFGGGASKGNANDGPKTMAVVSCEFIDGRAGRSIVQLFDVRKRQSLDQFVVSRTDPCLAVSVSPDGRFLAVSHESPSNVSVFRIADRIGNRIARPLNAALAARLEPDVKSTEVIALSPDESSLAFGPTRETLSSAWDLRRGEMNDEIPEQTQWKFASLKPKGWRVQLLSRPVDQILLDDPSGRRWQIDLERSRQGTYFTHCFLFAEDEIEPVGIAIGTENINSIFVYRFLDSETGSATLKPKLVRWFRDHTGPITSLIANRGSKVLFSGSRDHTIKLWRLTGLFETSVSTPFRNQSFWGCNFVIEQGRVTVRNVDPSGIAHARTLRNGDQIDRIQGYAADNPSQILDAVFGQQTAAQMLDTLNRVSVLNQNLIHATPARNAETPDATKLKKFIIRPAWLPFLTAFANRRNEWVIWHPEGVFEASVAEGGTLFEWMILRGADQSPRMLKAGFLAKEFERSDVIRQLLSGANVDDIALRGVSGQSLENVIEATPEVHVIRPTVGEILSADRKTEIVAEIDFGNANADHFRVDGNIDAVRLGEPEKTLVGPNRYRFSWEALSTGRLNQIEVIAKESGGVLSSLYASDLAYRRGKSDNPTPYQLHVLLLASENYTGPIATERGGFGELEYPVDDIEAILAKLNDKQKSGLSRYRMGTVRQLQDEQITKASVSNAIDELNDQLRQKSDHQILIVYLSGHGTTVDGQYHYITTSSRSPSAAALRESSLPWSLIDRAGVKGSRVIYMIDTCHSGTVVDAKSSVREGRRSGGIVIAAASGRGAAKEMKPLQHGCFTFSVLSALDGEADGVLAEKNATESSSSIAPNGLVDIEELVAFVRDDVRKLTRGQQKPIATPSRLIDKLKIDLVATPK